MSKEAYTFENINGKTAYLVGVVDTLCDEYLVSACPQYTIVEADLFEIDESQDFNKYIAARLKEYLPSIGGDAGAIEDKINKMKIEFEKETDFKSFQAPGCGKTLIAKAIAGEAGVPFLYQNASSFIDRFVGVSS